jgi:hypothetical protein
MNSIITQSVDALRKRTRRRIIALSFVVGIVGGTYFYKVETQARTLHCNQLGKTFPCAELDNAIGLAPFTFWLYTVPLGWALSWPIAALVHKRRGPA